MCKKRVTQTLSEGLLSGLFTVLTPGKQGTVDLEGASRGFGLLLHAFALRMKTEECVAISQEVYNQLS